MEFLQNTRSDRPLAPDAPYPSVDAGAVAKLLKLCPAAAETPLRTFEDALNGATLWVKDERGRMGLGSFKALGAAYVIAQHAAAKSATPNSDTLKGQTYITASAGNHGMSVAAGARLFGANAIVCIADTVPESFAGRLEGLGAEVRRSGADYAASMLAAETAAKEEDLILLSDSSWGGYTDLPHVLMEGYTQMAAEVAGQVPNVPTHIMLQAGVGGLAGALAAYFRSVWGDAPIITVVEPQAAPALQASIRSGKSVVTSGPDSSMGRLDCKEPSLIALNGLARDADWFVTLEDETVEGLMPAMAEMGLETSPSGGAGLALAMLPDARETLGITEHSTVLAILSEGPA